MVVGVYGRLIIVVLQGRHGHVVVYLVSLFPGAVAVQVFLEGLGVPTQVKGQFGVVVIGVLLDAGRIIQVCGLLEGAHSRHLVLQADIAVTQLVRGNLAQGIGAVPHPGKLVHGALPVLLEIADFAGIKAVAAGGRGGMVQFVIGSCLLHVTQHQVAFAQDAGQVRAAVFRDAVIKFVPVFHHIGVVFPVEAAFQDVVAGQQAETVIGRCLLKPLLGLLEMLLGIVHIAQVVLCRSAVRGLVHLRQGFLGILPFPYGIGAVTFLVQIFGLLLRIQPLDLLEFLQGLLVFPGVEQGERYLITDLGRLDMVPVTGQEPPGQGKGVFRAHLQGAEGAPGLCIGGTVGSQQTHRLRIHSRLI